MAAIGQDLIINRSNLGEAEVVPSDTSDTPQAGQCLLRIDRFALTANNITYGVAGETLKYWEFFPASREGWGRIPVWGFAEVIASAVPEIEAGTRVYGYLPMSSHLMIEPGQINKFGFTDMTAHRQPMSAIYNHYARVDADPAYAPDLEGIISLFRPLFTTSFLLEDFHTQNNAFGATSVILSSASSKTAIGLGWLLSRTPGHPVQVVGLTSPGNRSFTEGLGIYDQVVTYDDLSSLPEGPAAFVDMAGNADLLRQIHTHYGDALKNSCRVGLTHWQATALRMDNLPGPNPEFFFAPTYAQERIAALGQAEFQGRLGSAWAGFTKAAQPWITEVSASGPDAALATYRAMLSGKINPAEGHILSLTAA